MKKEYLDERRAGAAAARSVAAVATGSSVPTSGISFGPGYRPVTNSSTQIANGYQQSSISSNGMSGIKVGPGYTPTPGNGTLPSSGGGNVWETALYNQPTSQLPTGGSLGSASGTSSVGLMNVHQVAASSQVKVPPNAWKLTGQEWYNQSALRAVNQVCCVFFSF